VAPGLDPRFRSPCGLTRNAAHRGRPQATSAVPGSNPFPRGGARTDRPGDPPADRWWCCFRTLVVAEMLLSPGGARPRRPACSRPPFGSSQDVPRDDCRQPSDAREGSAVRPTAREAGESLFPDPARFPAQEIMGFPETTTTTRAAPRFQPLRPRSMRAQLDALPTVLREHFPGWFSPGRRPRELRLDSRVPGARPATARSRS
jgi:hypothetical protein